MCIKGFCYLKSNLKLQTFHILFFITFQINIGKCKLGIPNRCQNSPFQGFSGLKLIFDRLQVSSFLNKLQLFQYGSFKLIWNPHLILVVFSVFGPRVYQMESLVIALVSWLVCPSIGPSVGPSLNISETAYQFFLKLCIKVEVNKVKKLQTLIHTNNN